jgi:hypothetical protein
MGKIYLLKQIGEYWPKSAMDNDTDLYVYEIKTEEKGEKKGEKKGEEDNGLREGKMDEIKEIERLEKWIDDLQSGMYINCVYCGHRYPPGTNAIKRKVLHEHIKICPKHPLSKAEIRIKELEEENKVLEKEVDRLQEVFQVLNEAHIKAETKIKELHQDLDREMTYKDALEQEVENRIALEAQLAKIKSDPSIGKLEVQEWPESPDY